MTGERYGKRKKRDLIIALGFGIMMGMVNLFSHRILEIDFRSQELLEIQAGDLKWFLAGTLIGAVCYMAVYLINSRWDLRKTKTPVAGKESVLVYVCPDHGFLEPAAFGQ